MNVSTIAATMTRMPKLNREKLASESVQGSNGISIGGTCHHSLRRLDGKFGELSIECGIGILSQRPEMRTFATLDPPDP